MPKKSIKKVMLEKAKKRRTQLAVGQELRRVRLEYGDTQQYVAAFFGVSLSTVRNWEKGTHRMRPTDLRTYKITRGYLQNDECELE